MPRKLKALISKAEHDKLPKDLQESYSKSGDGEDADYVLDVEDKDYKIKLDEFRSNNRVLHKEKEALEALRDKYKDIDPDKWKEYKDQIDELDKIAEKDLIKAGKFDTVVENRTKSMREALQKKIEEGETKAKQHEDTAKTYKGKFHNLKLDLHLTDVVTRIANPQKGALPDILRRAREAFAVDDEDNTVLRQGVDIKDDKGESITTPEGFVSKLVMDAPHLFVSSSGGGAGGGKKKDATADAKMINVGSRDPLAFGRNLEGIASGKAKLPDRGD